MFISRSFYPAYQQYHMSTHMISYLGDYLKNPHGWMFFSLALMFLGLGFFPLSYYIWERIKHIRTGPSWLFKQSFQAAGFCIILVGFFPDSQGEKIFFSQLEMKKIHEIWAVLFFFLVFVNLFSLTAIFFSEQTYFQSNHVFPHKISLFFIANLFFLFFGLTFTQSRIITKYVILPFEGIYSLPMWEWAIFLFFLLVIFITTIYLSYKFPSPPD